MDGPTVLILMVFSYMLLMHKPIDPRPYTNLWVNRPEARSLYDMS